MQVADDAVRRASTGGDWITAENPLRGAPIVEYRSNGQPGGVETRPVGVAESDLTPRDRSAYDAAVLVFTGVPLSHAAAGLDTGAFQTLQTGRLQTTTPSGGGFTAIPTAPANPTPVAAPVITSDTTTQLRKLSAGKANDVGAGGMKWIDLGIPNEVVYVEPDHGTPDPSPRAGDTNTNGTATAPAPGATHVAETSATRGTITGADLGVATAAAPTYGTSNRTVAIVVGAFVVLLLILFVGGGK